MKILSKIKTGFGGSWVLVKYDENFYAYGYETYLHDFYGFPVDQCGTKEEVIKSCNSIAELCEQNMKGFYNKEGKGWAMLAKFEENEFKMLTEFLEILKAK